MIHIYPIFCNKKQYLDLLLLADEQESMIDRYLERGEMFVLADNSEVKASCIITEESPGIYENQKYCGLSTVPTSRVWKKVDLLSIGKLQNSMPYRACRYRRLSWNYILLQELRVCIFTPDTQFFH